MSSTAMQHAPIDNWNYGSRYYHQGYQHYYPQNDYQFENHYRTYSNSCQQSYKSTGYGTEMNSYESYNNYADHSPQPDNRGSSPYDPHQNGYLYNQQYVSSNYNKEIVNNNNNNALPSPDSYYLDTKQQYYQHQYTLQQQIHHNSRSNTMEYNKSFAENSMKSEYFERKNPSVQEERSEKCQVQQPSILSRALQGETSATLYGSNRGGYYRKSNGPEAGRSPISTSCVPAESPSPCLSSAASCESNLQAPIKMATGSDDIECDNMATKSEGRKTDNAYFPWMKAASGNLLLYTLNYVTLFEYCILGRTSLLNL